MKKLALLAIVTVLCGGAAFAQQDMGNAAVEGATYTTGIVQSINANSMTVLEDSGREVSVLLDDATVGGITPAVGARVRVDYRLNASNQAVAETIQLAPQAAATEETSAAAAAPAVSAPAAEPSPSSEVAAPVAEPAPADVPSAAASQDLPRTASELPLLALTALLGIAGAVTLRATR